MQLLLCLKKRKAYLPNGHTVRYATKKAPWEPFLLQPTVIGGYAQVKLGVRPQNHQPAEPH